MIAGRLDEYVEVLNEGFPFAVERGADFRRLRWKLIRELRSNTKPAWACCTILRLCRMLRRAGVLRASLAAFIAVLRRRQLILESVYRIATDFLRIVYGVIARNIAA